MKILERIVFHISVGEWLVAVTGAVLTFALLMIARKLVAKRLGAFAATTETKLDDLVVTLVAQTRSVSLLIVSLFVGSLALSLPPTVSGVVHKVMILTLLIQGALWANLVISFWFDEILSERIREGSANPATRSVLNFCARLILWSVTLLVVLDNLGFNITTLVAGLGVGGIAIALAVQNVLADLFASLSIILDKPFVIGDFIIVDDYMGTVKHVGLKTTRIQSLSGEEVIFSNTDLLKSRIRNYKRMYERRVVFTIGVAYRTPPEKLEVIKSILQTSIETQRDVRFDRAHFKEFGESALVFEAVYFVLDPDFNKYMDIQENINSLIFQRMREKRIDFAYPTRTVFVHQENAAATR